MRSATQRLKPEEYNRVLEAASLIDLTLNSVRADVDRNAMPSDKPLRLTIRHQASATVADSLWSLLLAYQLVALSGRRRAVNIEATFRLTLASDQDLSDDFLSLYAESSGRVQAWPYVRELASSLTERMGVPRLILPLLLRGDGSPAPGAGTYTRTRAAGSRRREAKRADE